MTVPPPITSPPPPSQPVPACVTSRKARPKSCPAPEVESGTYSRTFTYANSLGLHARPAVLLIKTLSPFKCGVTAQHNDYRADARSILSLLSLAVGPGSQVTFTARGPDAAAALAAIARLFESRFNEAYGSRSVVQPPTEVVPAA